MWFTQDELKTHMDIDNIDTIINNDDTIADAAIETAVKEAKGYLSAFDIDAVFQTTGSTRNSLLLTFVKDIAVWHLMALSNYKADIAYREKRYDRAVSWLKAVQKGDITPDLPVTTEEYNARILSGGNTRRIQHY